MNTFNKRILSTALVSAVMLMGNNAFAVGASSGTMIDTGCVVQPLQDQEITINTLSSSQNHKVLAPNETFTHQATVAYSTTAFPAENLIHCTNENVILSLQLKDPSSVAEGPVEFVSATATFAPTGGTPRTKPIVATGAIEGFPVAEAGVHAGTITVLLNLKTTTPDAIAAGFKHTYTFKLGAAVVSLGAP